MVSFLKSLPTRINRQCLGGLSLQDLSLESRERDGAVGPCMVEVSCRVPGDHMAFYRRLPPTQVTVKRWTRPEGGLPPISERMLLTRDGVAVRDADRALVAELERLSLLM
jgi:hypothetical protein